MNGWWAGHLFSNWVRDTFSIYQARTRAPRRKDPLLAPITVTPGPLRPSRAYDRIEETGRDQHIHGHMEDAADGGRRSAHGGTHTVSTARLPLSSQQAKSVITFDLRLGEPESPLERQHRSDVLELGLAIRVRRPPTDTTVVALEGKAPESHHGRAQTSV